MFGLCPYCTWSFKTPRLVESKDSKGRVVWRYECQAAPVHFKTRWHTSQLQALKEWQHLTSPLRRFYKDIQ